VNLGNFDPKRVARAESTKWRRLETKLDSAAIRRVIFCLGATSFLVGCAAPAYVEPMGSSTARLTIKNRAPYDFRVSTYDNGTNCTGRRTLATGHDAQNPNRLRPAESVTIKVPAGTEFAIWFLTGYHTIDGRMRNCSVIGSFVPASGVEYVTWFEWHDGRCIVGVDRSPEASESAWLSRPEPSFRLREALASAAHLGHQCN